MLTTQRRSALPGSLALQRASRELALFGGRRDSIRRSLLESLPSLTILLVRDSPLGLESTLLAWGHRVAVRASLPAALEALQCEGAVHLLLADWSLSQVRAGRFYRLARRLQSPRHLYCVAVVDDHGHRMDALEAGADALLCQGCQPIDLLVQLKAAYRLQTRSTDIPPTQQR